MNFDLTRLKNKIEDEIIIDTVYRFEEEQLSGTEIISPLNLTVTGNITRDVLDGYTLNIEIKGDKHT